MYKNIITVFSIFVSFVLLQASKPPTYVEIRKNYENFKKDDARALPYVNQYIQKAKKESDFAKLVQGYRDAVEFTSSKYDKLIYADSTIYAALASKDSDLISVAHIGKGIIYYFNFMKFKPALDQYVKAYQYAKNSKDEYHKHKILYHLGVVKNYLGYYEEAIEHFNACIQYFEKKTKEDVHPTLIYNYKRGYLNSLHQIIISYGNHEKPEELSKSDSIANIGLSTTNGSKDFALEKNYFLKSKGIINFYRDNYDGSISYLNQSLPVIIKADDFEWVSIIYFYLGRSYLERDKVKAITYFEKVDSIFNKHHFVIPRIRSNYEYLINYYKKKKDIDKELYYTEKLLKADSLISKDFPYLSSKIHREYDRQSLLNEKKHLEQSNYHKSILTVLVLIFAFILLLLFILYFHKKRKIERKYKELQEKYNSADGINEVPAENTVFNLEPKKMILTSEITRELFEKLNSFEKNNEFRQKGLTQSKLASDLKTNTYYLSTFINESKGVNFNHYIGGLRINYITGLLYSNKKYLHYKIEALAEESGFSSRQNFSDLFYEINGIRPKDFIRKRKDEIGID